MKNAPLIALLAALASAAGADTLRDVYLLALKNDAKLQAAEATFRADREIENIARAALMPQLNASGQYQEQDAKNTSTRIDLASIPPSIASTTTKTETQIETYTLQLDQTIFDLAAWFSFQSGKDTTRQAEAQLAADQQDLIVRTAQAYFNVLRARDNLEATRAEERATKRQLEQTQQRFDVGLIAITEVHEARAIYDSTLVQRLDQEGALATALEALTVITNQTHSNLWDLKENYVVATPEPADRDTWVEFALANNLALAAARYGTEAAAKNARSKKAGRLPTLSGSISRTEQSVETELGISGAFIDLPSDADTNALMFNLRVPIYNGGLIGAQARQAWEQYNAAQQRLIDLKRQTIQQTRAQHIAVVTDVARVSARQKSIISARSALDATRAGYEVGTRNIVDVLQAQRSLYSAMRDYSNARYDYVIDMLKLKQQAGTLTPDDINQLEVWLEAPEPPTARNR